MNGLSNKVNFLGRAQKLAYFWTADRTDDRITNPWIGPGPNHFCKNRTTPSKAVRSASLMLTQIQKLLDRLVQARYVNDELIMYRELTVLQKIADPLALLAIYHDVHEFHANL